jgi:hypothetical protein
MHISSVATCEPYEHDGTTSCTTSKFYRDSADLLQGPPTASPMVKPRGRFWESTSIFDFHVKKGLVCAVFYR